MRPGRMAPAGVQRVGPATSGSPASGSSPAGRTAKPGLRAPPPGQLDAAAPTQIRVPVTGIAPLDIAGDLINETISPFVNLPRNEDGEVNVTAYVANLVQGTIGIFGLVESLIDHGISILLAPFAQVLSLPAARLTDLHIGLPHGHPHPPSLIPPCPVAIPLPSLGMLSLSGAVNVLVGGIPAARAGDIGIAPTCFSFAPVFMVVTGSSSVYIGGSRAARMGDLTIHCNPILKNIVKMQAAAATIAVAAMTAGFVSSAAQGQWEAAVVNAAQAGLDLARDALKMTIGLDPAIPPITPCVMGMVSSGASNVMIGGLPVPPADILMGIYKGELVDPNAPPKNRRPNDTDVDPDNPRQDHGGYCKC